MDELRADIDTNKEAMDRLEASLFFLSEDIDTLGNEIHQQYLAAMGR